MALKDSGKWYFEVFIACAHLQDVELQWVFPFLSSDGVHRKVLSSGLESQRPPEWRMFSNFFTFGGRMPEIWQRKLLTDILEKRRQRWNSAWENVLSGSSVWFGEERDSSFCFWLSFISLPLHQTSRPVLLSLDQQMCSLFLIVMVCNDLPMSLHYPAALKWSQIIIQFPISHQRAESGWWNH